MSVNLSYIKPKHTLSAACRKSELCDAIITRVHSISNFSTLQKDKELLIFIMNCIENTVDGKKIDKKTFVIEILVKIFPEISTEEQLEISDTIDFICNNRLIQQIPFVKKYSSIFTNYIKNKL